MTPAQQKALEWVYETQGDWRNKAGRLHAALTSLGRAHPDYVECRCGNFGKRGGYEIQWRITIAGADAMMKQREV